MTSTDDELDAAVMRSLGRILADGDPYTTIPLVDPDTSLLPPPTVAAIREGLADAADVSAVADDVSDLEELTTDGRLGEDELSRTIGEIAGRTSGTQAPSGLVTNDSSAATANTAIIQAMLDSSLYRKVVLPEGLIYVDAVSVPSNKELTGSYSRAYTTRPTTGTRVQCATESQTAAVVTMNGRSKLTAIAVLGASGAPLHYGVRINSNGAVLRDCAVGFAAGGVDGNYKLAILDNVHIFSNVGRGITDILDGNVISCTINANGSHGIYAGTGANATQYIGNRIEWNSGRGISLHQTQNVTVLGNIVDRNGLAGINAVSNDYLQISSNNLWRNGALASATVSEDCNLFLQSNTHFSITGNTTKTGVDDDGGGYSSPIQGVRSQANSDGVVVGNDFTGTNGTGWNAILGDTGVTRHSNRLPAAESETFIGPSYLGSGAANTVAVAANGVIVLSGLPAQVTNSTPRVCRLALAARDHASSTNVAACVVDIVLSRNLSSAVRIDAILTNVVGSAFGLGSGAYSVSLAANTDGTELTITINNGGAATRSFSARMQ